MDTLPEWLAAAGRSSNGLRRVHGQVLIPRGDTEPQAHDQLVLFVLNAVIDKVFDLVGVVRE